MLGTAKISTRLWGLLAMLVVLAGIAGVIFFSVLNQVRIGSDRYVEIIEAKDIQADVLPPPLYLVETHLIAHQLVVGRPENSDDKLSKLTRLKNQYAVRFDVWDQKATDTELLAALKKSDIPAQAYFATMGRSFIPAARAGDRAEMRRILEEDLESSYVQHRDSVDEVVRLSTSASRAAEGAAAQDIGRGRNLLLFGGLGLGLLAFGLTALTVRSIIKRLAALRDSAAEEFPRMIESVKRSAEAGDEIPDFVPVAVTSNDELADAERAFNGVVETAVGLAADQARLRQGASEMFVNLGRRNHKLLSRTLNTVSDLERAERDPETLQHLFSLDHLITRMRRNAESLLVLAGTTPMRTWAQPIPVDDVLRAALSEVENYERVRVQMTEPTDVVGAAASDVAHLLAELLENSLSFSSPETAVSVTGGPERDGYLIYISDEGLGIDSQQLRALNTRLASENVDSMQDSRRLGLNVVARLASRHDIAVELSQNSVGGVLVRAWLPPTILSAIEAEEAPSPRQPVPHSVSAPDPSVVPSPSQRPRQAALSQEQPHTHTPSPEVLRALVSADGPFQAESLAHDERRASIPQEPAAAPSPEPSLPRASEPKPRPPVAFTPEGLPRRVRGANVDESLKSPIEDEDTSVAKSPEEIRSALADFSIGRQLAADEASESNSHATERVASPALAPGAGSSNGLTKRVRGANLADTLQITAVAQADVPARSAEEVRRSLADFAAGKLAAAEQSPDPDSNPANHLDGDPANHSGGGEDA